MKNIIISKKFTVMYIFVNTDDFSSGSFAQELYVNKSFDLGQERFINMLCWHYWIKIHNSWFAIFVLFTFNALLNLIELELHVVQLNAKHLKGTPKWNICL